MQFTAIFDCVIAIFAPLPPKFSRLRRAFGGRCAPGPAAPDPPLREHPRHLDSGGRFPGAEAGYAVSLPEEGPRYGE